MTTARTVKIEKDRPPRLTRQFLRDRQWVADHMQELVEKYPDQWIMVYKGEVIAHGEEVWSKWRKADELGLEQPYISLIEREVHVY
ncbi:MAG: DUF5678 domain-containing protein [candidate division KSB1 bacterium]|nr:DUF5678 domain-containing protein [candidate division KSB1 bacterium]MDZ7302620.1 DUF5678 domain-containing protein [candidate division KSB1 bacterium]MDZ7311540.1 DUF5678 domain-containing protein [candidate division KSB1 bacterium]